MTERRKKKFSWHEFRVGLFVIGSFAILLLMIFRVSGGRGLFTPRDTALTYLPTIEGMKPGAPVWLNGIEVGNVEEIMLTDSLPNTKANLETRDKIASLRENIKNYENIIAETETLINDSQKRLELLSGREEEQLKRTLRDDQSRLTNFVRTYESLRQELKISLNNLQNIKLILKIDMQYAGWIKKDSEVSIGSIGLLGDKYLEVSIGRSSEEPTRTAEGFIFIEGVNEATMRQLMVGANDLLANFGDISESIKSISQKLDAGEGTIGQLINNTILHDALTETVQSLEKSVESADLVLRDIHESEGTIGQLIRSKELYTELLGTITELKGFIVKLNQEEGTLHQLIYEPALYNNLKDITAKIDGVMTRIAAGEGTLGKLSTDDSLFVETRDSIKKIRSILESIEAGEGTIGMLVKDKQLYENLNQALSEMAKLVFDLRKNPKKYLKVKFSIF